MLWCGVGSFRTQDVTLSLLRMIANNIGHMAYLTAKSSRIRHICFAGPWPPPHLQSCLSA
jgi:pantothenate kinase